MKNQKIIEKLNQNNNFHLSLKVIQITDRKILEQLKQELENNNKKVVIINNSYEALLDAYNNKVDYVLIDETINYLLPLVVVITKEIIDIIKPIIPTFYLLKDNRIIQKVKTQCNKKMSKYISFKNVKELIDAIISLIN